MKPKTADGIKVAEYWGVKKHYGPNWYSFCSKYIMQSITGNGSLAPTIWALNTFIRKRLIKKVLEIGCLGGKKIISLVENNLVDKGFGIDIAEAAIAEAQRVALEKNLENRLEFSVVDLNTEKINPNCYDVVISNGVLHHIANLEFCIKNIFDAMRPGGYLFASEYIGPNRFNFTPEHIDLINEARSFLPVRLRGEDGFDPNVRKAMIEPDPSEAVRSEDIEEILKSTFNRLIVKPYGGNILMWALGKDFYEHFDGHNPFHCKAVDRVIDFESKLIAEGNCSHHAYFIGSKKG